MLSQSAQSVATSYGYARLLVAGTVRRNQLDSLRFLAISAVLFDHCVKPVWFGSRKCFRPPFSSDQRVPDNQDLRWQGPPAARRFSPPAGELLWAPIAQDMAAVLCPLDRLAVTDSISRQQFVYHGLFLTNLLQAHSGDSDHPWFLAHLWTLSVQEQFYLVWPALFLALTDRGRLRVIVLAVTAAVLFRAIMWATGHTGSRAWLSCRLHPSTPLGSEPFLRHFPDWSLTSREQGRSSSVLR